MIGKIVKSLHYNILNNLPGPKKAQGGPRKKKKPKKPAGSNSRDYRGVDGVVDDATKRN